MSFLEKEKRLNNKGIFGLIGFGVLTLVALIVAFASMDVTKVNGNEIGIKETWAGGIEETLYQPRTYFYAGWNELYRYDLTPQIFVMNSRQNDERAGGRPNDAYVTTSSDNQKMTLELALQWHYDPTKLINIHKTYRTHVGMDHWSDVIEERIIRQNLMAAVNTAAAGYKAIDAYSGEGFVSLQRKIIANLSDPNGELAQSGIIVETFVIEKITLDENYIGEINKRQVAQQRELRAQQEEKAAMAESLRAKAESMTKYEQEIVTAKQEKEKKILASEGEAQQKINAARAQAEQQVIEAKGQAEKVVLAAKAEREAAEARAAAILALGQAEAEAKKLNMLAYSGAGADNFVTIEVSRSMATAFSGIQGYIPQGMTVNTFTTNWMEGLGIFGRNRSATATK